MSGAGRDRLGQDWGRLDAALPLAGWDHRQGSEGKEELVKESGMFVRGQDLPHVFLCLRTALLTCHPKWVLLLLIVVLKMYLSERQSYREKEIFHPLLYSLKVSNSQDWVRLLKAEAQNSIQVSHVGSRNQALKS